MGEKTAALSPFPKPGLTESPPQTPARLAREGSDSGSKDVPLYQMNQLVAMPMVFAEKSPSHLPAVFAYKRHESAGGTEFLDEPTVYLPAF